MAMKALDWPKAISAEEAVAVLPDDVNVAVLHADLLLRKRPVGYTSIALP
ncbi:hypothetical protein ACVI1L_004766 [Bradyrhizobium sp. USDA 4516]